MRTFTVIVCPVCRRQATDMALTCPCAELWIGLEPVEIETVALDDPRIIASPDLARTATRSCAPR